MVEELAVHLIEIKRGSENVLYDEYCIENAAETRFDGNRHNGETLALNEDDVVFFVDVVSGSQCVTMIVCFQGVKNSLIMSSIQVFQNSESVHSNKMFLMLYQVFSIELT